MPITIQIKLMSGEIIPFVARSRMGVVKYTTVKEAMKKAVLAHLQLSSIHTVELVHEDDEEKCQIQWIKLMTQIARRLGRWPDPSEEDINQGTGRYQYMREYIDKERRYHDGDLVNAIVNVNKEFVMADEQPIAIEEDIREDEFMDAWHMELQEALDAIE